MKAMTASVIFGLVTAATGVAHATPERPRAVPATAPVARTLDAAIHALLRAPLAVHAIELAVAKPLVDESGDVACGNVMTKGGSKHVCRNTAPADEIQRVLEDQP